VRVALVTITNLAAEKIKEIMKEQNDEHLSIRIKASPG
jgi:Fe-S cluster assembly iron-binding protein IscA